MKRALAALLLVFTLGGATGCHRLAGNIITAVAVTALYLAVEDLAYDHYHSHHSHRVYCEVDHDGYHHYEWEGEYYCRR